MNKNNKIIDIEATVTPIDPKEEIFKQLKALNDKLNDDEGGEWIYVNEDIGIVWRPNPDAAMGNVEGMGVPTPPIPPTVIESLVEFGKNLDFDGIPENAVVLIKLNIDDPYRVQMLQQAIAKQILGPRIEKLKEKKVCILFMQAGDDISVMTESDMSAAGWERKEKSRIITL